MTSIALGEAHIWIVEPGSITPTALEGFGRVLSFDEHLRMQRFHRARERATYLVAHGLLRSALSWCAPEVRPEGWRFAATRYGRPEVANFGPRLPLRFNISHTDGLIACVIARGVECGVDVEEINRRTAVDEVSHSVLSRDELVHIARAGATARDLFFRLWTLKEAYAKARGLGMSLPFDQVGFELSNAGIELRIDSRFDACPARWRFAQWSPTPRHIIALALECCASGADHVLVRHGEPPPLPGLPAAPAAVQAINCC